MPVKAGTIYIFSLNSHSPNPDSTKANSPKAISPNDDSPNAHSLNAESPNVDTPIAYSPNVDSPTCRTSNCRKTNSQNANSLNAEPPNVDSPKADLPNVDWANADLPNVESPNAHSPIRWMPISRMQIRGMPIRWIPIRRMPIHRRRIHWMPIRRTTILWMLMQEHRRWSNNGCWHVKITFKDFDFCHRIASFRKFYSVTLTKMFKVKPFKWLFRKWKHYYCHYLGSQVFAIEWQHCECCTSWPWPTSWRSRLMKTVRVGEKCSRFTFIEDDFCYRTASLWMLYFMTLTFIFKVEHFLAMHLL